MAVRFVVILISAILLATVSGADGDRKDDKKDDKDLLQGEWAIVELGGKKVENPKEHKLLIRGDEWTRTVGGGKNKLKIKIDATKSPKQIDLIGEKETFLGIYKIEGDTLTISRSNRSERDGAERPTEFKSGPKALLMVWKRAEK